MQNLAELFACPVCHGPLQVKGECYSCEACTLSFPISGQVPCFINERLYPSVEIYNQAREIINYWGQGWAKRLKEPEHSYLFADNNSRGCSMLHKKRYPASEGF